MVAIQTLKRVSIVDQFITGVDNCKSRSTMCVCVCVCHDTTPLISMLPLLHPNFTYQWVFKVMTQSLKRVFIVDLILQLITGMENCKSRSTMCACVRPPHLLFLCSLPLHSIALFYCLCVCVCVCVLMCVYIWVCVCEGMHNVYIQFCSITNTKGITHINLLTLSITIENDSPKVIVHRLEKELVVGSV